ncbi:MAG: MgtC/SapB family protein [Devosia sp.]|nr:MgtC/SapB family protein [Devosia sp.]
MTTFDLIVRLAVALGIGLLVGLERGWQSRDEEGGRRAAGFRTFALSGLLGGAAAVLGSLTDPVVLGFVFVGYLAVFAAFHWIEARAEQNFSVTGVVAGGLTFVLGAIAVLGDVLLAGAAAVAMTLLLALREQLHRWVASLTWQEIRAVLTLLAMSFLLLPILPRQPVDPWGVLNLFDIWLYAILIAAISFGGYVAVRVFGDRLGVLMAALAGGLASSTAVTVTLARLGKEHPASARLLAAGILVAGVVMAARVGIVAVAIHPALLGVLGPPLVALGLVLAIGAAALLLTAGAGTRQSPRLEITNPLALATALRLAAFIALVIVAAELAHRFVGAGAVLAVAAVSGIADVDAVTVSMAGQAGGAVGTATASLAILVAVAVNTLSKAVIAATAGGRTIGMLVGGVSLAALLAAGLSWIFLA